MNDELILVEKDGEQIRISPLTLDSHQEHGWKIVDEPVEVDRSDMVDEPVSKKSKK